MKNNKKTNIKKHPKVIAGKIKGKTIKTPPGEIRPMTGRVKESLFNILGDIADWTMLDLFTGSGNISIEAFSRGIKESDLIEADFGKKTIINENLKNAGFESGKLIIADALIYCEKCYKKYDFIMLDPPFRWEHKEKLIEIISKNRLLKDDGIMVLHIHKKDPISPEIDNFICEDIRTYGINTIMFYKWKQSFK